MPTTHSSQHASSPGAIAGQRGAAAPADAFSASGSSPPATRLRQHQLNPGFALEHGATLKQAQLSYSISGPDEGPTVLIMGGISADRHIVEQPTGEAGWWSEFVGPGRSIDTRRVRVISIDYLGGCGDSSAPLPSLGSDGIPAITPRDQALAVLSLLTELGVQALDACIGASYGGMVGLALATLNSRLIGRLLVISAGDRAHPLATAWRVVQRRIVQFGDSFDAGIRALALARELAMTTYRSRGEFAERFDDEPKVGAQGVEFSVQPYLSARGRAFVERFTPLRFLTLSQSLDLHRIDPAKLHCETTLVAVDSDHLVPPEQVRSTAKALKGPVRYIELSSRFGHDAFLKESRAIAELLKQQLKHCAA